MRKTGRDARSTPYYKALFEDTHVTMLLIDPVSGDIVNANTAASKFYGWSCAQLKTMRIFEINMLPATEIRAEMQQAKSLKKRQFDFRHRLANGEIREVEVYSGPLEFNGTEVLYSCVFDVSERKRAERAIQESENNFRFLFNNGNDAIFVYPHFSGRFSEINNVACEWLGYSREEMLELFPGDILTQQSLHNWEQADAELVETGKSVFEVMFVCRSGSKIPAEVSSTLFTKEGGQHVISVARDVSTRERVGRALFQAREAKADSRAKSRFMANISHELRTPVNGILGMLQLIEATPLDKQQNDYIHQAMTSCRRLTDLLNNVLNISCIEAGTLTCEKEPFSLKESIHFVRDLFQLSAQQKQLEFSVAVDDSIPPILHGDKIRIEQILTNLVGNSVKFTENGGIEVEAHMLPGLEPGKTKVLITVADSGIGIPESMMTKVFKPFRQADSAFTRRYQGAGLGLSIVKQLLLLLGGNACLVSEYGKGTKFYISIPLELAIEQQTVSEIVPTAEYDFSTIGKVLVVEDDDISRLVLVGILKNIGIEAESAGNGAEALEILKKSEFDLILMDVQMPVMDGLEATQKIRNRNDYATIADIPIIGVTAHTSEADRLQVLEAGLNSYVSKPVSVEKLKEVLRSYCNKK